MVVALVRPTANVPRARGRGHANLISLWGKPRPYGWRTLAVGRGFGAKDTMSMERYFEAGEGAKAV